MIRILLGALVVFSLLEPCLAQEIQMYQSQTIQIHRGKEAPPAKPVQGPTVQGSTSQQTPPNTDAFIGTWGTHVPGGVYETPSNQPGWNVLHVSPGAKGAQLTIHPDGRFQWGNMAGRWDGTRQPDYPLVLRKAKGNRDWKVGWARTQNNKPAEIVIWDGFTWYNGTKLK